MNQAVAVLLLMSLLCYKRQLQNIQYIVTLKMQLNIVEKCKEAASGHLMSMKATVSDRFTDK